MSGALFIPASPLACPACRAPFVVGMAGAVPAHMRVSGRGGDSPCKDGWRRVVGQSAAGGLGEPMGEAARRALARPAGHRSPPAVDKAARGA